MADLGLLGSGWEDPQSAAIMALSAGLLRGDLGGALLGANNAFSQSRQDAMKQSLMSAQLKETLAQAAEREANTQMKQRRADNFNAWIAQIEGAPSAANQDVIRQTGNLAPTLANAQLQSQAFGRVTAGNPLADVDPRAARADMMLNEGKNIPDWLFKRTTPDMQNINGVWVDKNKASAGSSIPQISQNGQASQLIADPSAPGGYRVIAPAGALDVYGAYQSAGERAKAMFDPTSITPKGATNPVQTTRLNLVDSINLTTPGAQPAAPTAATAPGQTQIPGDVQQSRDRESLDYIAQDVRTAESALAEALRKGAPAAQIQGMQEAVASAKRDYARRATQANSGGPAGIELQSPATAEFNKKVAGNEAGQVNDAYTKAIAAKQALPTLWSAQELLKNGTFTGMGADAKMNVIRALGSLGVPIPDSVANSQAFDAELAQIVGQNLKSIVGSTNISNADVQFVTKMFGERGQEAKAIKYLLDKAVEGNFRAVNNYNGMLPGIEAKGGQTTLGAVTAPNKAASNVPAAAINYLRSNPGARAQFEAKYGAGSAAAILGQ